jgi:murein DD-endopeptidase MepM/ murein hydrolase activator NlpD
MRSCGLVRTDVFGSKQPWRKITHTGEDYDYPGNSFGKPIYSPVNGIVERIINKYRTADRANDKSSFGNFVQIRLKSGYLLMTCHHEEIKVNPGDKVKKRQVIATIGATGDSRGAHVHVQINKPGTNNVSSGAVNPYTFQFAPEDIADPDNPTLDKLIVYHTEDDGWASEQLERIEKAPRIMRAYVTRELIDLPELLIQVGGPEIQRAGEVIYLSGSNRYETALAVINYLTRERGK